MAVFIRRSLAGALALTRSMTSLLFAVSAGIPNQNAGMEIPKNENAVKTLSNTEYWRTADTVPMAIAIRSEKIKPVVMSMTVFGRRDAMIAFTG